MPHRLILSLFAPAAAILLLFCQPGYGQGTGFGTTSGGGGATAGGGASTGFGATTGGGTGFGSSGNFGSSFGTGTSATGTSAFGTTGTTTGGATTFVGRGGQTAFVGRGAGLQSNAQLGFTTSGGRANRSSSGSSSSGETRRPEVRIQIVPSQELLTSISRPTTTPRFALVRGARRGLEGVDVRLEEGVTVLEGVVTSESRRRVAEALVSLEPGVGAIDNRIQITPPAETVPLPR